MGGPYLFGEDFGLLAVKPDSARFTLADYEFS
jgi:hypothetical protein